jgi:hypothetical protein
MNEQHDMKMTLRVAGDARRALEIWSQQNLSTMTAEVTRCVRERIQREQRERRQEQAQS